MITIDVESGLKCHADADHARFCIISCRPIMMWSSCENDFTCCDLYHFCVFRVFFITQQVFGIWCCSDSKKIPRWEWPAEMEKCSSFFGTFSYYWCNGFHKVIGHKNRRRYWEVNVCFTGLGYTHEDTLTVRSCYHSHGKIIFNWRLMHPITFSYSEHSISNLCRTPVLTSWWKCGVALGIFVTKSSSQIQNISEFGCLRFVTL